MAEEQEVRATHEEVEAFVGKLKEFHSSLDDSGQAMLGSILDSAQGEESEQAWNDLVGWIEEQGGEDTQGFIGKHR